MHRTSDGCRPDQLFGLWAIEETRFATLIEMVRSADLAALHAASAGGDAPSQTLYAMDDRIALIGINGPMTKYPTSFSSMFGGPPHREAGASAARSRQEPRGRRHHGHQRHPGRGRRRDCRPRGGNSSGHKPETSCGFEEDLTFSAGLWALSECPRLSSSASTEIGSSGTYMLVQDSSRLYEQAGVKVHVISCALPQKRPGVPGTEVTDEQFAQWQRRIDDVNASFVS